MKKKIIVAFLVLLMGFIFLKTNDIKANDISTSQDSYQYPSIEYLLSLETMDERYAAANIDLLVLRSLSDEELIEAIINYPFLMNIYAYDTDEQGIDFLRSVFNGVAELERRNIDENTMYLNSTNLNVKEKIIQKIIENSKKGENELNQNYSITYVTTPKGSSVPVYVFGYTLSAQEVLEINAYMNTYYPNVEIVDGSTNEYNCHSYAWYSANSSNRYWMDNPSLYMTDGSYLKYSNKLGTIYPADRVWYGSSNHSAIVSRGTLGNGNLYVVSKWGRMPLVRHGINESPYSVGSNYSNISFWYRNLN